MAATTSKKGSKHVRALKALMRKNKYETYDRPYEMNIVGIRSDTTKPNSFDDMILVWYKNDKGQIVEHLYPATTDPSTYWLEHPSNPKGAALLKQGQYKDAYTIGLHAGKYKALRQNKPVTVLRQYDRKNELDFLNGKPDTGMFGINIHRASSKGTTKEIGRYSAGCQVFANADDFNEFLGMAERQKELYGNKFTYTLFDARAKRRAQSRKIIVGILIGTGLVVGGYFAYKKWGKKLL